MGYPDKFKINEDKSLTVWIDGRPHLFTNKQYLRSDNGKIMLKHSAVVELAGIAGVTVEEPVMLQTHGPSTYVFSRRATRSFVAVGETNKSNLYNDMMKSFPAETADNRAYERAVLGILGLHGDIYGASEISYKDGSDDLTSAPASKKEPKKTDKPENTESPTAAPPATEEKATGDGNPFWWDDLGMGVYTDKQLDPEICPVTEGPKKGSGWNVKQLYDYHYESCKYFAERTALDNANEDFQKQVYSCRRAIRKYGLK